MSEKEKMISGEYYDPEDPTLRHLRENAEKMMDEYNKPEQKNVSQILEMLMGYRAEGIDIRKPFYCDYGINIKVGRNFYANYNCVFLDVGPINIGDDVFLGPGVSLITVSHPLDPEKRRSGKEYSRPINIGNNVWLGADVTVNPGVTIGENAVIGSGSVVTKDIPSDMVAVGNPCRPIKSVYG